MYVPQKLVHRCSEHSSFIPNHSKIGKSPNVHQQVNVIYPFNGTLLRIETPTKCQNQYMKLSISLIPGKVLTLSCGFPSYIP